MQYQILPVAESRIALAQRYYRASYIEMQRIDATTRSPIYAHFSETLNGVSTAAAATCCEIIHLHVLAVCAQDHYPY